MREAKLTKEQLELYKKMNISEQVSAKRLLWMISDVAQDSIAAEYQDMLDALFRGAYIKYEKNGQK